MKLAISNRADQQQIFACGASLKNVFKKETT
jgi:hypothetical protein